MQGIRIKKTTEVRGRVNTAKFVLNFSICSKDDWMDSDRCVCLSMKKQTQYFT